MKLIGGRPYRMDARARSAEETGQRILDAAVAEFWDRPSAELSLENVAVRAGVSVRTVIRRFGGKEALLAAAVQREMHRTSVERETPVGDLEAAVRVLVAHYERIGDKVLKMLAEEHGVDALRPIADQGRRLHRDWCRAVFSPALSGLSAQDRRRRLAQCVAVCDVHTWKLLRRQQGLSRRQTEIALIELLTPMMEES
jgi:AcrR family transcriptional regulator